jgi:predicted dehydrogenase
MMQNIGLVGCGSWGKNILRDLLALHCRVHVVDADAAARMRALECGAEKVFAHAEELPVCDGYVVAVPIPDLAPVCIDLLKRKKPLFVEKTLCLSLKTADDLEKLGGNKYIFAMHKWHYHPGVEALRVIAHSGRIGTLKEMFTLRHGWVDDFHGGDVFWTLTVHDITIVKHIFGYIPERIIHAHAIQNAQGLPISLTAVLGQDPVVSISVNARHTHKVSAVSIHGDKGSAVLHDCYDDHITVRDEHGEEKIGIDTTFPLYLELKEFVSYLQGGPRPRCDLQSVREVTRVLLDLRKKALPVLHDQLEESLT